MDNVTFNKLNLSKDTLDAITKKGFTNASEVQAKAIPVILENKNDLVAIAQTGTGKTAAFGLPLIEKIGVNNKTPKAIILAPTRELAVQVTTELTSYFGNKKLKALTVYGGTPITGQIKDLNRGIDIVVGTPGRVVDLINRRVLDLSEIDYFVLDEADEMLNMGFLDDMDFILDHANKKKRVYLFSATMPQRIKELSKKYMKKQIIIEVEKKQKNLDLIEQIFYRVNWSDKFDALSRVIDTSKFFYGIVFCKTRSDVDEVTANLKKSGYKADCIHGDVAQSKREKILQKFRDQKLHILVATDVAARGIDVNDLTHVINYSLPQEKETYVHRVGRTGRAGKSGIAISLITQAEMRQLSTLEKICKVRINKGELPSKEEVINKRNENSILEIEEMLTKSNKHEKYLNLADSLLKKFEAQKVISTLLAKLNSDRDDALTKKNTSRESNNNRSSRDRNSSRGGRGNSRDRDSRGDRNRSSSRDRKYGDKKFSRNSNDRGPREKSVTRKSSFNKDRR